MALIAKSVLTVIGCCSVGLPVFIITDENSSMLFQKVSADGSSTQIIVRKCQGGESSSESSITFGDQNSREICWEFKPPQQSAGSEVSHEQQINAIFTAGWNKESGWSSLSISPWNSNCPKNGKGWALIQPENGEYLGICDQSNQATTSEKTETLFLHKQTNNGKITQIKLCIQDCWNDDSQSEGLKSYQTVKDTSWSEVKLQKNN